MNRRPPRSPLFPYTPLFRSVKAFDEGGTAAERQKAGEHFDDGGFSAAVGTEEAEDLSLFDPEADVVDGREVAEAPDQMFGDRKSTRLNSSHSQISYAVFCLK